MKCPKCGETFKNKHAMHTHYGLKHEGSIAKKNIECNNCGEQFKKWSYRISNKNYCSQKCFNNQDTKKKRVCDYAGCDNEYEAYKYRIKKGKDLCCSMACAMKKKRRGKYFNCKNCDKRFYRRPSEAEKDSRKYCSKQCKGLDISGKNHYAWKEDSEYVSTYYGGWRTRRQKRLKKDEYTCQECGAKEKLHVHHIEAYKVFDDPFEANKISNLITLCETCHLSYENGGKELSCLE